MSEDTKVVEISHRDLTLMEHLDQWLKELVFPGKVENFIEEVGGVGGGFGDEIKESRNVCFYTENHCYFIDAIVKEPTEKSYIGCSVNARKSRPAEDWSRGNDLPDGPFNKETWNKIVYAIVNYELVKLSPYRKPDEIPEDVA